MMVIAEIHLQRDAGSDHAALAEAWARDGLRRVKVTSESVTDRLDDLTAEIERGGRAAGGGRRGGLRRVKVTSESVTDRLDDLTAEIESVARASVEVQCEAPFAAADQIQLALEAGASLVGLTGRAFDEPDWLAHVATLFPGLLVPHADLHGRRVRSRGWARTLPHDILDVVDELGSLPLGGMLVSGARM